MHTRLASALFTALISFAPLPASAQGSGRAAQYSFDQYRVSGVYRDRVTYPDFSGRDRKWSMYRTRIREGIQQGPNFAGRLAMIEIGCGTGCRFVPIVDLATGQVTSFPLGGEDNPYLNLLHQKNSRLVIAYWETEGRCMEQAFVWTGGDFKVFEKSEAGRAEDCLSIADAQK